MANEIRIIHDDAAETVYAIVRDIWRYWYYGGPLDCEHFEAANWATYAIALAQVDVTSPPTTGNVALQGTFSPGLGAWAEARYYWVDYYVQAGGSPAQTDWRIASVLCYWDLTSLVSAGAASPMDNVDSTGTQTIPARRALEVLLAWAAGAVTVDSATGIATYKARDGVTPTLDVPMVSDASRLNGTM